MLTAIAALDKDDTRGVVAFEEHRRKSTRRFGLSKQQIDQKAAFKPRHGKTRCAALRRVTRFGVGEQRVKRLVILGAA